MIIIVDYGAGNLTSVKRAVSYLGYDSIITDDPEKIANADRIIFPGVGAAGAAMEIMQKKEIDNALKQSFKAKIPMLGICVGCQIIMERSEENDTVCLGLIKGEAKSFPNNMKEVGNRILINDENAVDHCLKVPHMGWNGLNIVQNHPLFNGIEQNDEFYFVHSYFPVPIDKSHIYGETQYGITFASAIGKNNLFATQFHLEKSGEPGLLILKNFCLWKP
ncbi:MAG: imidazole glycerol phosphate synthase subunit HisH [Desulfamplus sp.]|nr:imidazole glycerol phosphate synthase subunit HisH [Desulfamplus sp.]